MTLADEAEPPLVTNTGETKCLYLVYSFKKNCANARSDKVQSRSTQESLQAQMWLLCPQERGLCFPWCRLVAPPGHRSQL